MDARLQERRMLEVGLRQALARGEFRLAFQPLFNLAEGRICCLEALLRWYHPERGTIPPDDFIPVAEDTGLIVAIGEWVLREACRVAAGWPPDVRVAVNLSTVPVPQPQPLPPHRGSAGRLGPFAATPRDRGHRVPPARRRGSNAADAAPAARARRPHLDGRFRHRLFVLSYLRSFPFDQDQDRPIVRERPVRQGGQPRDRGRGHRPWPLARHVDHRRRGGNRRPA